MKCESAPNIDVEKDFNLTFARDVDEGQELPLTVAGPPAASENSGEALATVLRDATNWLPHVRSLKETDVIILLTPVAIPISSDPTDTR